MALKHTSALLLAAFVSLTSALSHAAPTINTNPSSATPALGSTATLAASVTAQSGATFVWSRDGTTIINGGRYSGATTATLSISGANASDNGNYTLTVSDGTGTSATTPASITVTQTASSLDPAYNGAGSQGSNVAVYTNTALHLPDGRSLLAVKNQFNGVSGTATSNLVVMSAAGAVSHPGLTTPGTGGSFVGGSNGGDVRSIFRMADGKILVAGDFTTHRTDSVVNTARNRVARLNADLTLDTTFVATGPSAVPQVVFADGFGRVYLGGTFNTYDGSTDYRNLVRLNADGTLDTSFKPLINGGVASVVFQSDGKFIVSGPFIDRSAFPTINVPGLIRFLADGTVDTSFVPTFPDGYATQTSLAVDASDNLYVGRSGATATVFKLSPSGSLASGFTAPSLAGQVNTMAVLPNGKVAIGGFFTTPTNRFMVLNTDGTQDTGFNVGTGFNSVNGSTSIQSIVPDLLGRIWIMGINFSTYNGAAANRFAVLQGSGAPSLFFTAHPGGRVANQGTAVSFTAAASGNNGFTYQWQKNGSPLSNGGNVSGATTATLTLSNTQAADEAAYSVVISSPGTTSVTSRAASLDVLGAPEITQDPVAQTVDFGGTATFTGAATGATPLTYQWFYGTTALTNGTGVSGATTNTLTLTNVDFDDAGQYSLKATNGLGNDTSTEATLTVQKRPGAIVAGNLPTFVGVGYGGYVSAIQPLSDGSYLVGGAFDRVTINGVNTTRKGLVRIKADGTLDTNFPTVNSSNRPSVEAIVVDAAGRIFIGGDFTSVLEGTTETPRLRVARLTSAFALDTAFNTSTVGPDKIVRALATAGDGSVYIGGEFTTIGTTAIRYIAKLNASGARDAGFTNSISTGSQDNNKSVNSICRLANGTLYVGSSVSSWGTSLLPGQPAGRLVKLSATGARDLGFASPDIFTIINAIIALPDGSLFAGGNAFGQPYVKRLNGSTGADLGFTLAGHALQSYALHRQADGKLLSGSYGVLKRTDASLVADAGFDIGTGFSQNYIRAITTDSKGRIFVGGEFTSFNGQSRERFVILNGNELDSRTSPKPGQTITFPEIADKAFVPGNAVANTVTITLPTSSSLLPVTTVVTSGPATLTGNKLVFTGAGTVVLTASQAGDQNFMAATVSQTIEVSKASQTLTFAPLIDRPTGSAAFLLGAAASSGLPVSYQVLSGPATVSGNVLTLTGATGTVSIRASQPGNSDFTAAASVDQSFDVFTGTPAKLPQSILFNPLPPRSGSEGPTFTLTASATSGLPLTYTFTGPVTSIVGNVVTLSGAAGTVTITAKQAGNANFLPALDVKQSFAVTAAATTLTLTNLIQTYTGTPRAIGTVGGTGTVVITYGATNSPTAPTNAGTYPVKAVAGGVTKTGSLVINKAPLIIAADDKRKFVGQDNPALSFAYSGFLGSDNAGNALSKAPAVTTTATKTSPGGNYPITPAGATSANYAPVYVKGNMKVETFAGTYEALLTLEGSPAPTAKLEIIIVPTGATYSGKIFTGKETTPFPLVGTLPAPNYANETLTFTKAFTRGTGAAAVTYNVTFTSPLDGDFTATVTRATGTPAGPALDFGSADDGKKIVFPTGTPPVEYAGAHTAIMGVPVPLTTSALPLPAGSGFATALIDSKGKMTFAGALPDGTKFTTSLLPDKDAGYRLYFQPYTARIDSYFGGWLPLKLHPNLNPRRYIALSDGVDIYWAKAKKTGTTDPNYREGIPESAMLTTLDPWLPPLAAKTPNPAITLAQRLGLNGTGEMEVSYSGLVGVTSTGIPAFVNLTSAGLVTIPGTAPANNPRAWKLTIAPATGLFTGSYTVLDGAKSVTVNLSGVMRQPATAETNPADIGAGQGLLPQLTGQTTGTTITGISLERPGDLE